jgi:lipoxygenase
MAVRDENAPHGLRLRIEDYPYAADGLLVWDSIEQWVRDYVSLYYSDSQTVLADVELQQWWTEIRTKGHADKKDEPWWPTLDSPQNLVQILSTMIWVASGHHAAVNFGQYDYSGFVPNQPCLARRLVPEPGDPEFRRLLRNPHKVLLETLPGQEQATVLMMVVESLSTHSPDEEYLGYNGMHTNWTSDARAVKAFKAFSARLAEVDKRIHERNGELMLKHRSGAGTLPYQLLLQKSGPGITMRGIPNSISI